MAFLSGTTGLPQDAVPALGNVSGGARTALGNQGGANAWFAHGASSVPGDRGRSFRRASPLPRSSPYPNPDMQHVQQPPQAVVNAPVPALQNQLPAAPVAQDVEMDPLLADINRLISSLSLEPMLPLTKVEFTDVPVDLVNLMVRQDDFISSGSFKELVPDFIERAIKVYHGECDALHKALHTLKLDAALYAQGKWPRPLQHKSGQQFKKEMKEESSMWPKRRQMTKKLWKISSAKLKPRSSGFP